MTSDELKYMSLLSEFDDEDREALFELVDPEHVAAGESLFCEGEEADALFWIVSGSVRLRSQETGALGLVCEGGNLGAISLMTIGTRHATAETETDCEILRLTRGGFRRLADDFPRTGCRLAEAVAADLASELRSNVRCLIAGAERPD